MKALDVDEPWPSTAGRCTFIGKTEKEARELDDKIYTILTMTEDFDIISFNKNPEEYIIHKVLKNR